MRKISKNEIRLLALFGGVIFLTANLVAVRHAINAIKTNFEEISSLRSQYEGYQELLNERDFWEARSAWRKDHPLLVFDESRSGSAFVESIQSNLHAAGLTIEEQQLSPPERQGGFVVIVLTLKISGGLEQIVKWATNVQKPGSYSDVEFFSLKATDKSSAMSANLKISQYFVPYSPVATP